MNEQLEAVSEFLGALRQDLGPQAWMVPVAGVLLLILLAVPTRRSRNGEGGWWVRMWAGGAVAAGLCLVALIPR